MPATRDELIRVEFARFAKRTRSRVLLTAGAKTHVRVGSAASILSPESSGNPVACLGYVAGHRDVELFLRREIGSGSLFPFGFVIGTDTQKNWEPLAAASGRVFGPVVQSGSGRGLYDVVERYRSEDFYMLGVSPSDRLDGERIPTYLAQCAADFFVAVSREFRLGKRPSMPRLLETTRVTKGAACPRCGRSLAPFAITCHACGWAEGINPSTSPSTAIYPAGLDDT
jgi:hypothetical protein